MSQNIRVLYIFLLSNYICNLKGKLYNQKEKKEKEKAGLKFNSQKIKIMVSGPITSWQIHGETLETVTDFISLGSKITADVTAAMKLKDSYFLEGKL